MTPGEVRVCIDLDAKAAAAADEMSKARVLENKRMCLTQWLALVEKRATEVLDGNLMDGEGAWKLCANGMLMQTKARVRENKLQVGSSVAEECMPLLQLALHNRYAHLGYIVSVCLAHENDVIACIVATLSASV
jgi:hypothetical protein